MFRHKILLILFSTGFLLCMGTATAQQAFEKGYHIAIKNFAPRDYKALPQNWAITQNNRGILFFGNNSGVLEYDGISFRFHAINDKVVRSLDTDEKNLVYVGAEEEFGFLKPNAYGALEYVSLLPFIDSINRDDIGSINYTIATTDKVFFISPGRIYTWDKKNIQITSFENEIIYARYLKNRLFLQLEDVGLSEFRNGKLIPVPGKNRFEKIPIASMLSTGENGILIITENQGIFHYRLDGETKDNPIIRRFNAIDNFLREQHITCAVRINDDLFALGTEGAGAAVFNQANDQVDFINFMTGLQDEIIYDMAVDSLGNLWMALNNGLSMTPANAAVTYFGPNAGLRETVEDITRYRGKLIAATHTGCYYLTKYQMNPEIPWIVNNPIYTRPGFIIIKGTEDNTYALCKYINQDEDLLLAAQYDYVLQITPDFNTKVVTESAPWDIYQSKIDPSRIIVANENGIETLIRKNGKWFSEGRIPGIDDDCRVIAEDTHHKFWVGTNKYGVLYKLFFSGNGASRKTDIMRFDTANGLPIGAIYPYLSSEGMLFGTNAGLYRYNDSGRFFADTTIEEIFRNKTRDIHRISEDYLGNLWLVTYLNDQKKYETGYLYKDSTGIHRWISEPFLSFSKSVLHAIYHDKDGITWLGGPDGLYRYDPSVKQNYGLDFYTQLRSITAGTDSILFKGVFVNNKGEPVLKQPALRRPVLPYKINSLTFEYSAPLNEDGSQPQFSYYLEGFDKEWSPWNNKSAQGYTNLKEGDYIFHVRARNLYDHISHEASFAFSILPPWYRTVWAYILFFVLAVVTVYLIVFFYTKNLRQIISDRTAEVRKQKDEIEQKNRDILDSIHYAQRIQSALLPPEDFLEALFPDRFILYMPRDIVSGDFYWVAENHGKIVSATADCTGHGVPGAFMSMLGMAFLSEIITKEFDLTPAAVLNQMRKKVIKSLHQSEVSSESQDGMDMAFCSFDFRKMTLTYSGANLPLFHFHHGKLNEIKPDKMPIGISRRKTPFEEHEINIHPGDVIYTFSDGYIDQFGGPNNKKFMIRNLRQKLLDIHQLPMAQQKKILHTTIVDWIGPGGTQVDDILVVGIRV